MCVCVLDREGMRDWQTDYMVYMIPGRGGGGGGGEEGDCRCVSVQYPLSASVFLSSYNDVCVLSREGMRDQKTD